MALFFCVLPICHIFKTKPYFQICSSMNQRVGRENDLIFDFFDLLHNSRHFCWESSRETASRQQFNARENTGNQMSRVTTTDGRTRRKQTNPPRVFLEPKVTRTGPYPTRSWAQIITRLYKRRFTLVKHC